jgi:uncharacterized membrane protein
VFIFALIYAPGKENISKVRKIIAFIGMAAVNTFGYYLAGVVIYGNWVSGLLAIPMNILQSAAGVAIFFVLYPLLLKITKRGKE